MTQDLRVNFVNCSFRTYITLIDVLCLKFKNEPLSFRVAHGWPLTSHFKQLYTEFKKDSKEFSKSTAQILDTAQPREFVETNKDDSSLYECFSSTKFISISFTINMNFFDYSLSKLYGFLKDVILYAHVKDACIVYLKDEVLFDTTEDGQDIYNRVKSLLEHVLSPLYRYDSSIHPIKDLFFNTTSVKCFATFDARIIFLRQSIEDTRKAIWINYKKNDIDFKYINKVCSSDITITEELNDMTYQYLYSKQLLLDNKNLVLPQDLYDTVKDLTKVKEDSSPIALHNQADSLVYYLNNMYLEHCDVYLYAKKLLMDNYQGFDRSTIDKLSELNLKTRFMESISKEYATYVISFENNCIFDMFARGDEKGDELEQINNKYLLTINKKVLELIKDVFLNNKRYSSDTLLFQFHMLRKKYIEKVLYTMSVTETLRLFKKRVSVDEDTFDYVLLYLFNKKAKMDKYKSIPLLYQYTIYELSLNKDIFDKMYKHNVTSLNIQESLLNQAYTHLNPFGSEYLRDVQWRVVSY